MPKVAVFIPCYQRPEYTEICLKSVFDQTYEDVTFYLVDEGGNRDIIQKHARENDIVSFHARPQGLRNTVIEFFEWVKANPSIEYIAKLDNDCIAPEGWISNLISSISSSSYDILSPNVFPSNAAFLYGKNGQEGSDIRPSELVGGLWCMRAELIRDIDFERFEPNGIAGAFNLLKQIILEKETACGWLTSVTIQDVGHWSGSHPLHIKSKDHEAYSAEVGRPVSWSAS